MTVSLISHHVLFTFWHFYPLHYNLYAYVHYGFNAAITDLIICDV